MKTTLSKSSVYHACLHVLRQKIDRQKAIIQDAQQSAAEDTKSSAGDKYETSREMMKQEIQKAQQQMVVYAKMEEVMMKIKAEGGGNEASLGSLIKTSEGYYFLSVSLGQIKVSGQKVYVLSMASPMGKALTGKKVGEKVHFRRRELTLMQLS